MEPAVPTESARWGDAVTAAPCTLAQWRTQRQLILETYMPQRAAIGLTRLRTTGLYP